MLSVNRLINVTVNLGATPVAALTFNVLMIAGDSPVISGLQRFRTYSSIEAVGNDFGITTPEFQAAEIYFSQSPQPASVMIGRWLASATAGYNLGAILSPTQQVISAWTGITSGGFEVAIDGASATSLTGMNFSSVTNLNGIASIITAAFATASVGAACTWNGSSFVITSSSTGPGASATGTVTLTGQPAANDTLTIDGTAITFVTSSPVGNQVVIGTSSAVTFANLLTFLQQSADTNISKATYQNLSGQIITVTAKTPGTAGNSFTLAKSSSALAVSAGDLAGGTQPSSVGYAIAPGSGTDISAQLGLTVALSQGLAAGYASETPVQCVSALASMSPVWYGLMFASTATVTDSASLAVSAFVEALSITRMYGVTTAETGSLSSIVMNDLGSLMMAGGYDQSFCQYSSTSPYAVASMFGRMFSVNFLAQNSTIELMYKQMPGITAESLTDTQANALQAKNINVYASYVNGANMIQYGTVASGNFIDEIWGLDWFQNAVQSAEFNLLYTAPTKIAQTDAGQNQLVNGVSAVCGNSPGGAVYNGLAGPGTWNSTQTFGSLQQGQFLPTGFYIYTPSVDSQAESDRVARKAPPIQVALKLAGAFQSVDVIVTVNQ